MTRGSERGTPLPRSNCARPGQRSVAAVAWAAELHADELPPIYSAPLQGLIAQAQTGRSEGCAVCKMHERWHAACEEIAQGKTQEVAFERCRDTARRHARGLRP